MAQREQAQARQAPAAQPAAGPARMFHVQRGPAQDGLPNWYNDLDLPTNREYLFGGIDLFGKTYLCNVAEYYDLRPATRCALVAVIAIAEAHLAPRSADAMMVMVSRMIAETIVVHRTAATPDETQQQLCTWARAIWRNQERQVEGMRLRLQDYVGDRANGGRLAGVQLPDPGAEFLDTHNCWAYLVWVAERGVSDEMRRFPILAYVYTYVALAKRGTITIEKMRKIAQAVTLECGIDVALDRSLIGHIWGALASRLTDEEYQAVFERWEQDMMNVSLRMRITLMQAACSGLTSLVTCRNALRTFPDFPWSRVAALLPGDTARLIAAAAAVDGNRYYGFKKDYGAAASSGYRSFTWVAKELLLRYGGPDYVGLREYRGWTTNPLHKTPLQELIDNYTPQLEAEWTDEEMRPLLNAMTRVDNLA